MRVAALTLDERRVAGAGALGYAARNGAPAGVGNDR
jgi:hypothetical protein